MQRRATSEEYHNFLYNALSSLEEKDSNDFLDNEANCTAIEGLNEAWTVTVYEWGVEEEFVKAFCDSEEEAYKEKELLIKMGVKERRITIYKPGELFSM